MADKISLTVGALVFDAEAAGPEDAPLVLLLHGYPQTSYTWQHQLPALGAAGFRAVAPNQRGYSPRARPDAVEAYHVDHLVADVLGMADALGRDRFHLVGHDWGGAVSWLVAATAPERLMSLSVLSRPHPFAFRRALKETEDQAHRSRHHKAFQNPDTESLLLEDGARRLRRGLADNRVAEDAIDAYLSVLGDKPALTAALNWYRAALGDLSRGPSVPSHHLGAIDVPTLYIWGDEDSSVGQDAATWTADFVAAPYRFETLKGIGHFSTDQAPESVSELLVGHIEQYNID